jgi:crossover junction endodeoxyribonuclease RuvC
VTRILGIDPGSHRTGWGVIDAAGTRLHHVASGVLSGNDTVLAERLCAIADGLDDVLDEFRPDAVAVEAMFASKNHQSSLKLGHARGVALLCVARKSLALFEYAPAVVKRSTAGSGRADKRDVARMVQMLLGHGEPLLADAADALAVAICHQHATPARLLIQAALDPRAGGRR